MERNFTSPISPVRAHMGPAAGAGYPRPGSLRSGSRRKAPFCSCNPNRQVPPSAGKPAYTSSFSQIRRLASASISIRSFHSKRPLKSIVTSSAPHMKTHVIIAEPAVDQAGNQMLPRMFLHMQKSPVPVDFSPNRFSRRQRLLRHMDDPAVFFMYVQNADAAQDPSIRRLSPALWIKRRLIQNDLKAILSRFAGKDRPPQILFYTPIHSKAFP